MCSWQGPRSFTVAGITRLQSPDCAVSRALMEWLAELSGVMRRVLASRTKGASFPRTCSLCGYHGWFWPAGRPQRIDVRCPRCGSTERSRLLALWLDRHGQSLSSAAVLHFAPEPCLERLLRSRAGKLVSA